MQNGHRLVSRESIDRGRSRSGCLRRRDRLSPGQCGFGDQRKLGHASRRRKPGVGDEARPADTGSVMLLPGGHGNINLDAQAHVGWGEDDFLIRTRMRYANGGLLAIVPDVAADKPPVSLEGFRTSPIQANDLHALAGHLRGMTPKVWIVAYDSGATSALNAAARGKTDTIAGLVLISPILEEPEPTSNMLIDGAKLALAGMPVLLISHESDWCSRPAVDLIESAAAALKAPNFQSITIRVAASNIRCPIRSNIPRIVATCKRIMRSLAARPRCPALSSIGSISKMPL